MHAIITPGKLISALYGGENLALRLCRIVLISNLLNYFWNCRVSSCVHYGLRLWTIAWSDVFLCITEQIFLKLDRLRSITLISLLSAFLSHPCNTFKIGQLALNPYLEITATSVLNLAFLHRLVIWNAAVEACPRKARLWCALRALCVSHVLLMQVVHVRTFWTIPDL